MSNHSFPALKMADLQASLATIQLYGKLLSRIRGATMPHQKHWGHISLHLTSTGIGTKPMPADGMTFELLIDLTTHHLVITTSLGEVWRKPLAGQTAASLYQSTLKTLAEMGITLEIDDDIYQEETAVPYVAGVVMPYWHALVQIDMVFKAFKAGLREETSSVQFWPHHMDLAMLWFSGRLVPDVDPEDEEYADEQMNFGFAPADETVPEPYFYITAYPKPQGLTATVLPTGARWLTEGFNGAVLTYADLITADNPAEVLLTFLQTVQQAGAKLMQAG